MQLPKLAMLQHYLGRAIEWAKDSNLNRNLQIKRVCVSFISTSYGSAVQVETQAFHNLCSGKKHWL